ncbi:receptor expression-enhancing protein 5-like [Hydractinia symbiolongicarpus]|uniref:receptor expression-enhancing protein 5-like n=1 Tax=Hydractinia symbiolongicarpus TaxID=13093 RepID=UPI00254F29BD|nr:receptor expression-enhancing protein 5-like [Hydractinia symbiolongicarpus]
MTTKKDKTVRQKVEEFLNEENHFTNGLAFVEKKTGVNRLYLFGGCVTLLSLYLVVGYASGFVVALLGFLYPAYASVKAIESTQKDDDTQWLTYWVVYAAFNIIEFFSDMFLSWFPLYFLFKCAFLGWCMAPFSWNGSEFIYHRFIAPFVLKHEKEVDSYLKKGTEAAKDLYGKAEQEAKKAALERMTASGEEQKKDE